MTRTAARTGRLGPPSPLMDVPGPNRPHVAWLAAHRRRTRLVESGLRLARPAGGTSRGARSSRPHGPTPAYDDGANYARRRYRSAFQLHIRPADIHQGNRWRRIRMWRGPCRSSPARGTAAAAQRQRESGSFQPSGWARAAQTVSRWRPLSRLDFKMALPARVDMRLRKPWVLARFRVFGW